LIKAVLFDLGNTLVYSNPEETLHRILGEHGMVKPVEEVREAMVKCNKEFDIEKHEGLSAHEFYTQWNLVQLKHLGLRGPEARELAEAIDTQWWKFAKIYAYPDVKETLQRLGHMRLKLGIVTGGFEEDIEMILPKTGLSRFFEAKVGANTTGKRKPHPAAFKYALRQLDVRPREAIFIGDNFENDYLGAQKVSMVPILIKRKGSPTQTLYTGNYLRLPSEVRTIESLDEIFTVLEEFNS